METIPWLDHTTFCYIDYNTIYTYTGSEWWIENLGLIKAIYNTSLVSSNYMRQSLQNAKGNFKVPTVEQLVMN